MTDTDPLAGFTADPLTFEGSTKTVFRAGEGPGVVVIHEVPGVTPAVASFGRRLVEAGYTVAMPVLFGEPGRAPGVPYMLRSLGGACVAREFTIWATDRTSPIIAWLRALARDLHERAGGPGVGAVGMCFTGGFALAMAVDDRMLAPVLSQPSMPFPIGRARKRDLQLDAADLAQVKARAEQGQCVLGLRFTADPLVPAERFTRLAEELGDRFLAVEIDSSPGNPHGIPRLAHSVLTEHLVDEPGHPTRDALERVLAFFAENLRPA